RAGRGVAGEVDDTTDKLTLRPPHSNDADFRGRLAPGLANGGVPFPWMRDWMSAPHLEAAFGGHFFLVPFSNACFGFYPRVVSGADRLDNRFLHFLKVFGIRAG